MPARPPRRSPDPLPDQLALAFDLPVPTARSAPPAPRPPAVVPQPDTVPPAGVARTATPSTPSTSTTPTTPAIHRHPRANRELRLGEHLVGYELRRARRRSIGFVVGSEGLAVSAPRWVGQSEIDTALLGKASWILRKLHDQADRQKRVAAARIPWGDGAELPFLGAPLRISLDTRVIGAQIVPAEPGGQRLLRVGLAASAEPAQIRDAVQAWLQRQARALFDERVRHFAPRLGVSIKRLSLSSATTRWGSASSNGTIRLNWRLIHHALPTIDYVVVHELAHLREMNHSPAFWDVVRSVIPDVEVHRGTLKDETLPVME
jgi:predicted metal-dependent hydrolase